MLVSVEPLLEKFEFEDEIVGVDVVFEMCFNGEIFIGFKSKYKVLLQSLLKV